MEMETVTKIRFINTLQDKEISIFSVSDLKKLFNLKNQNTVKHLLRRLNQGKIIKRLIKNKYLFLYSHSNPSDFLVANNLVVPSYISLESALSYYGLISQFPYSITSITPGKSRKFSIDNKTFIFSKIKKDYFKDYSKIGDFLIAEKKKALFDYFYFVYKGLRPKNSIEDLSIYFKEKQMKRYFIDNADDKLTTFLKTYVKL